MEKRSLAAVAVGIVFALGNVARAESWFDTGWGYRLKVTADAAKVPSDQNGAPILVDLSRIDAGHGFWTNVKDGGGDLIVTKADGTTRLPLEVISCDATAKTGEVYFKGDLGSAADTDFYLYYGNAAASQPAPGDAYGSQNVWDANFAGVWHLNQDPSGGAGAIKDSTANPIDGTAHSMTSADLVDGKLGKALDFSGDAKPNADYVRLPSDGTDKLSISGDYITLEAWVRRNGGTNYWMGVVARQLGTDSSDSYNLLLTNNANDKSTLCAGEIHTSSAGAVPDLTWTHLVGVRDGGEIRLYADGVNVGTKTGVTTPISTDANDTTIGAQENDAGSDPDEQFMGRIDEARISNIARSTSYIQTQYNVQSDQSAFWKTVCGEEERSPLALLVVGDPASVTAGDTAVKERLEGMGYLVVLADDAQSAASDADGKALVFICESVLPGQVNVKFRDVTVPVVCSEALLFDDMEMADSCDYEAGQTQVEIVDDRHALAAGLSGTVTVYTGSCQLNWGAPNLNAAKVAIVPSDPGKAVIFGYEAGAAMFSSLSAPARRVGFFTPDKTGEADMLTVDGQALFDAAVYWAVGLTPEITTQPSDQIVIVGGTATFTVQASGTEPLSYQWYENGTLIQGATGSSYTTPAVTAGDDGDKFRCRVTDTYGVVTSADATLTVAEQAPYGGIPWVIPGTVEAEDYDHGGEGIAYHDTTTGNNGGAYRSEDVDIQSCADAGGGYNVGWTVAGEWLEYTVEIASSGSYDISARVASASTDKRLHIEIDGADVTGPINVPSGGWQNWHTVTVSYVQLSAGRRTMRVVMDTGSVNLNYVTFAAVPPSILTHPSDETVVEGDTVTFTVEATGTEPLSYQWYRDSAPIEGATLSSYTTPPTTRSDSGQQFTCTVTDVQGSTTSDAATLTVIGLVGQWTLDERSFTTAADSSGLGNPGTLKGCSFDTSSDEGAVGNALRFDGVDDYVTIANEQAFDITDWITVSAWIKVDSFTKAWQAIVTKGDTAWRLHRNSSTDVLKFNCDGVGSVAGSTNVNDGFWHHVAALYDGSTISLYVDGSLDGSGAASGAVNVNDYPVCIGENAQTTGRTFHGLIDDVRIYDRALSPSEIDGLRNMGLKAPTITSPAPTTAKVGQLYSYTVKADGYPAPCLAVSGLPAWLSFDSGSNTVSGTPQASDVGFTGTITVTAGNDVDPDDTQPFAVAVTVPWLDPSWGYRLKVVIDAAKVPSDQTGVPVLFDLSRVDPVHSFWSHVKADGGDLIVTAADGTTRLPLEVVSCDAAANTGEVWFKGDLSASSDTEFYMYYGNASASQPAPGDTYGSQSVWTSGYAGVWHLNQDPSGGTGAIKDSTASPIDGTAYSMTSANLVDGKLGKALDFSGDAKPNADYVRLPSDGTDKLSISGDTITLEAWASRDGGTGGWMNMVARQYGVGSADSYNLLLKAADHSQFGLIAGAQIWSDTGGVPDGMWKYLVGVRDGTEMRLYADGAQVKMSTGVSGSFATDNNDTTIGAQENDASTDPNEQFKGKIDEVRISNVARDTNYAQTQYNMMSDQGTFWKTVCEEESGPPVAPSGLVAVVVGPGQIDLDWADNTESDLDYYNVYRDISPGFTPDCTTFIGSASTSEYVDTTVAADTEYYYVVTAVDTDGRESPPSAEVTALEIDDGLVGHWTFDNSAQPGHDDSGNENHLTVNGPTWTSDGRLNAAITFDGTDDYADIPLSIVSSDVGTVSYWLNTDADFPGRTIVYYGSDTTGGNGYGTQNELHVSFDGSERIEMFRGAAGDPVTGSSIYTDGQWHHVVAVWDISGLHLHVDGLLVASAGGGGGYHFDFSSCHRLGRPGANQRHYAGLLDDVRLYNRALTAEEVLALSRAVTFDKSASNGAEGLTPAVLAVSLTAASATSVSVDYSVTEGTATAGNDYTLPGGTLIFGPGEIRKHISIDVLADGVAEADETIEVTLSNAVGAPLGAITVHTYTINEFGIVDREVLDAEPEEKNDRIDRIRMVASAALNDDFSDLAVTVADHVVTGFDPGVAGDAEFFILLEEKAEPDTGAPDVQITANTKLQASATQTPIPEDTGPNTPSDAVPSVVASTSPEDGADPVSVRTEIVVAFSEAMDRLSTQGAFSIDGGVTGSLAWPAADTLVFTPSERLANATTYTATIGTGAQDLAGNGLAAAHTFSFTTGGGLVVEIPGTSKTSPAFIEGEYWQAEGEDYPIIGNGPQGDVAANVLDERRFFVNVPLEAGVNTVKVRQEGTSPLVEVSDTVEWAETVIDTDSGQSVTIRKGDSLLLVTEETTGTLKIDLDYDGVTFDVDKSGPAGTPIPAAFNSPGEFIVHARVDAGSGDEFAGEMTVVVIEVDLSSPIACQIGYKREKDVPIEPATYASSVHFGASDTSLLEVSVKELTGTGATVYLRPLQQGMPVLMARIEGETGPIVAHRQVDEYGVETSAGVVVGGFRDTQGDFCGTAIATLDPLVPDLILTFTFLSPGATFEGGVTEFEIASDELEAQPDGSGTYEYAMYLASGVNDYCHEIVASQVGSVKKFTGTTGYANGGVCVFEIDPECGDVHTEFKFTWTECQNCEPDTSVMEGKARWMFGTGASYPTDLAAFQVPITPVTYATAGSKGISAYAPVVISTGQKAIATGYTDLAVYEVTVTGPAETTEGHDSTEFTVTVTPSGAPVTSYEWTWEAEEGGGHNPHVDFATPDKQTTIVNTAWWYALPDNRLWEVTGFASTYRVNCSVTICGEMTVSAEQPHEWVVRVPDPMGTTPAASFQGFPDVAERPDGVWYVSGQGNFSRRLPTGVVHVSASGDFHAKVTAHEARHVEQYTDWDPLMHTFDADKLYSQTLRWMTADTRDALIAKLTNKVAQQDVIDLIIVLMAKEEAEKDAYSVSNALPPNYLEMYAE